MEAVSSEAFESMPQGRYNWQHLMLRTKYSFRLFRNPKTVANVKKAFEEIEQTFGFKIRELGFGEDFAHIHLIVEVPGRFSMNQALQIFKSHSASRLFEQSEGLRKRYPRGELWSGYRYNGSIGPMTEPAVKTYIQKQDIQQRTLAEFS
jgi:REP element-mobilizing transposase RayT